MDTRWLCQEDLDRWVLDIERRCFRYPWVKKQFMACLRDQDTGGKVIEDETGRVVGYVVYRIGANHINLMNIAVHPEDTGCGYGKALIDDIKGKLHQDRRTKISAEVCESNVVGQRFLKRMGFRCVRTLHKYYESTDQDCYVFEFALGQEVPEEAMECSRQSGDS